MSETIHCLNVPQLSTHPTVDGHLASVQFFTNKLALSFLVILPYHFCICSLAHICKSFLWESSLQEFSNLWLEFLGLGACAQSPSLSDIMVLFKAAVPIQVVMTSSVAPHPCLPQVLSDFLIIPSPKLHLSVYVN